MKELAFLFLAISVALLLWIRLAPHDVDRWHVDPAEAEEAPLTSHRLVADQAPRFPGDPTTVLRTAIDVARELDGARILDGGIDEGMITFVARTKLMGFPDYVTFKAVAEGDQTKLAGVSRSRYGGSDHGVNRERLNRWYAEIALRLGL